MFVPTAERNHHSKFINYLISKFNFDNYLEIGVFQGNNFNSIECEYRQGVDPYPVLPGLTIQFKDNFIDYNCIVGVHNAPQFHKGTPWIGGSMSQEQFLTSIGSDVTQDPKRPGTIFQMTSNQFFDQWNDMIENIPKINGPSRDLTDGETINVEEVKYDVIFIDGDHSLFQVNMDFINSLDVLKKDGFILIDDIEPPPGEEKDAQPWELWCFLRATRPDLSMCTVRTKIEVEAGRRVDYNGQPAPLGVIKRGGQETYDWPKDVPYSDFEYFMENKDEILNVLEYSELDKFLES